MPLLQGEGVIEWRHREQPQIVNQQLPYRGDKPDKEQNTMDATKTSSTARSFRTCMTAIGALLVIVVIYISVAPQLRSERRVAPTAVALISQPICEMDAISAQQRAAADRAMVMDEQERERVEAERAIVAESKAAAHEYYLPKRLPGQWSGPY